MAKFGHIVTEATREKLRQFMMGRTHHKGFKHSDETKAKMRQAKLDNPPTYWKGRKHPAASLAHKGKKRPEISGENHYRWKGGITSENMVIRHSIEYKEWRTAVFTRDNFTCQICNERGGELNADHIKSFSGHPELRFDVDNGRTLCRACHLTTHNWGGKGEKREDFDLDHKAKLSKARKDGLASGRIKTWNKGLKGVQVAWNKGLPNPHAGESKVDFTLLLKLKREGLMHKDIAKQLKCTPTWVGILLKRLNQQTLIIKTPDNAKF